MAVELDRAARLAQSLRELREAHWPDAALTQAQLAAAFSTEIRVAAATISAWESSSNPKVPTSTRLIAYARFFATRRSLDGEPHLIPETDLTPEERKEFQTLEKELVGLLESSGAERRSTFAFNHGPVTVICPDAPRGEQSPLAREKDPNFTKLLQYGDLDALIEIYGHLRAYNQSLDVFHRLASEVRADDLSTHVILLGGVAWNQVTRRFQDSIRQIPITQIEVEGFPGDVFEVAGGKDDERYEPLWDVDDEGKRVELLEDVALLVRLPNPFNSKRTLTICNGVHSRGVYGAVRCLTDHRVRDANEEYLARRFPEGRFALLLRVPVVANETLSPDLTNESARLYEWPSRSGGSR
jgi:hypothetical protein